MKHRMKHLYIVSIISLFSLYSENRIALVIGNSDYQYAPLKNPKNDADDITKSLEELGFDVLKYTNTNQMLMKESIR
jgi:uncharacterized protein